MPECVAAGQLCVFVGSPDHTEASLCWFQIDVPGYAKTRVEYVPTPIDQGLLDLKVALKPTTSNSGAIELSIVGASRVIAQAHRTLAAFGSSSSRGFLHLTSRSTGHSERFAVNVVNFGKPILISHVPPGQYLWRLSILRGLHVLAGDDLYEPDILDVREGCVAKATVDAKALGGIEVVLSVNGECYGGAAVLAIASGPPEVSPSGVESLGNVIVQRFATRPYVFAGLKPGEYTLKGVHPPWPSPDGKEMLMPAFVESGTMTTATVEIVN